MPPEAGKKRHLTAAGPVDQSENPAVASPALASIAASAICAKRPEEDILEMLTKAGADQQTALEMIHFMKKTDGQTDHLGGFLMILVGALLFAGAIGIGAWFRNANLGFEILPKGMGAFGIFVALAGLVKFVSGKNDLTAEDLVGAWNQFDSLREPGEPPPN